MTDTLASAANKLIHKSACEVATYQNRFLASFTRMVKTEDRILVARVDDQSFHFSISVHEATVDGELVSLLDDEMLCAPPTVSIDVAVSSFQSFDAEEIEVIRDACDFALKLIKKKEREEEAKKKEREEEAT